MTELKEEDIIFANQKLNEWCGTGGVNFYEGDTALGFLFKYAVPKLNYKGFYINLNQTLFSNWHCRLWADNANVYGAGEDNNPALALLWAIWEVIRRKPKSPKRVRGISPERMTPNHPFG